MVELKSNEIKARMERAIDSLKKDLSGLRVGRASSSMLDQINVNAYGSLMPINQVSTVSVPEARLLLVNVWDSSIVSATEKSIRESPLGLNPMVEGNVIRINIPPLSEERRVEITKVAAKYAENRTRLGIYSTHISQRAAGFALSPGTVTTARPAIATQNKESTATGRVASRMKLFFADHWKR